MTSATSSASRSMLGPLIESLKAETANTSEFGKAFEDVADLALWSSPEFGARIARIWRWEDWPGADGRDLGIDRVLRTVEGELWAVQVKGYSPSTRLTYSGKSGISTFLAAAGTGQFSMQLIVTSSDAVVDNARRIAARQAVPTRILDRAWLDSLDVDWPVNLAGLRNAAASAARGQGPAQRARAAARHDLREHQNAAITDVLASFAEQGPCADDVRAKLLMPCGTGKTLTCHGVAEQLDARQVLVLVPSLALLSQTMRAWQEQSRGRLRVIAVCSDETVAASRTDEVVVEISEILAPVTTDAAALATFLTKPWVRDGVPWPTVVFCTYHSSPVVAAAQKLIVDSTEHVFDLLVADEAHYLAGKVASSFATALDQNRIRARRRLFATATPRIVSTRLQHSLARDGRDHGVVSMDDVSTFGPTAHELRFSQALASGLLTDYTVLILGVDDANIADMVRRRTLLTLDCDGIKTDAANLAAAVAAYRVAAEYAGRRLISYHSRVARAEDFAQLLPALAPILPPDLETTRVAAYSIKGTMPAGKRRAVLRHLSDDLVESSADACVVANARCLTEGIDVPALDGVMFVDPRRSRIDVVQSVGRAIRLSQNKTHGLVVIPVHISHDDDIETAFECGAFNRVWDVLGALRDHDDALAEELDALRTCLGWRGALASGALSKVIIDLPTRIDTQFADAIRIRAIEHTTSSFHRNLGLLQAYAEREGNARIPVEQIEGGVKLGFWAANLRATRDRISPERRTLLEKLPGWTWDPLGDAWAASLAAARQFTEREGHARIPVDHVEGSVKLGQWVVIQRTTKDRLSPERRAQLEALPGWSWDVLSDLWADAFAALEVFVQREGHARVPRRHVEEGTNLGTWVAVQRRNKNKLSPVRRAKLDAVPGWTWDPFTETWDRSYIALQQFSDREGHSRVPPNHVENDIRLGAWVVVQRGNKDKHSPERHAKLDAIPGWSWDARTSRWAQKFEALQRFARREGHALVPQKHTEDNIKLGSWVNEQRQNRHRMSPERCTQLESMPGWSWDPYAAAWNRSLRALISFVEREHHTRVPKEHVEGDIKLGGWVSEQRSNRHKLSDERRQQLEAVHSWTWDSLKAAWLEHFTALERFVAREGHSRVPTDHFEGDVKLGQWLRVRRRARDSMPAEERALFEALPGWTWNPHNDSWNEGYTALLSFAGREGHTRVPGDHLEGTFKLGGWVREQRANRANMTHERRDRLTQISGWTWTPFADAWERNYQALVGYINRVGHARVPQSHREEETRLGSWVAVQRAKRHSHSDERRQRLEALPGWTWDPHTDTWNRNLEALRTYATREGHTQVPHGHIEGDVKLGTWAYTQRKKKDRLAEEQRRLLEEVRGWLW